MPKKKNKKLKNCWETGHKEWMRIWMTTEGSDAPDRHGRRPARAVANQQLR